MVQKRFMALDCWFPAAQPIEGQVTARPTPQQTTPRASQQQRKQQKGATSATTESSTPLAAQLPTLTSSQATIQPIGKAPQETRPLSQPIIIGSQVAAASSGSTVGWECSFHLGDKVLPSNLYVRTWRNGLGG